MGLRSPSAWTGRDSSSQWTDNSGKGLTQAQERMDKATSPLAGQAQTEVTKPGEVTAEAYNAQQEQQKQAKEQAKQQKAEGFSPVEQQLQQAESKLSTFGSTLRAYTNQFLQGAAQTVGTTGGYTAQYGANGIAFTDNTMADVSGVQEQKLAEQKRLQNLAKSSGFTRDIGGKLYGKEFTEAMSMAGKGFDTDIKGHIDSMTAMVAKLDELQAKGRGRSSEAQALEAQLNDMDSTGMVTGLRQSRDSYNKLMGLTPGKEERWYAGQGGTGYTALELAKMDSEKVSEEVEKALSFSSGLFGGDFSSNLKSLFDSESADVKASQQRESAIQKELSRGFQEWEGSQSEQVQASTTAVNDQLDKIAQDLAAEAQGSNDTAEAAVWMSAAASGDLTKFFTNMINDTTNGMSTDQRSKLGELMSRLQAGSGDTGSLMHQIATTGQVTLEGKTYRPNTSEKLAMLKIMQDDTITEEEKNSKLKDAIGNLSAGGSTLNTAMSDALKLINDTGISEAGITQFKNTMKTTMKNFVGSKTELALRDALGITEEQWNAPGVNRADIMKEAWSKLGPVAQKDLLAEVTRKAAAKDIETKAYVDANEKTVAEATAKVDDELTKINDTTGKIPGSISHAEAQIPALLNTIAEPFSAITRPRDLVANFDRSRLPPLLQAEYDRMQPAYIKSRQATEQYLADQYRIQAAYADNRETFRALRFNSHNADAEYDRIWGPKLTADMQQAAAPFIEAQKEFDKAESQSEAILDSVKRKEPKALEAIFGSDPAVQTARKNIVSLTEARANYIDQRTKLAKTANNIVGLKDGLDDVVFTPEAIANLVLKTVGGGSLGAGDLTGITEEHQVKDAKGNVIGVDMSGGGGSRFSPDSAVGLPTTVTDPLLSKVELAPETYGYGERKYNQQLQDVTAPAVAPSKPEKKNAILRLGHALGLPG